MRRYGLIGRRLGHSWSQRWFEERFAREGLADCSYRLYELPSVVGLRAWALGEGLRGFNVTVPYKQAVIPELDTLDAVAAAIGAVNCVTVEGGRLIGHNTDAPAFRDTLSTLLSPLSTLHSAYILGTGGGARAVAYALEELGIAWTMVSRTPGEWREESGERRVIDYGELSTLHAPLPALLVNATPVGMYPDVDATPLDLSALHSPLSAPCLVYDLIYNPSPTLLLRQAAALGARTCDGLAMLHRQAELSWTLWQN